MNLNKFYIIISILILIQISSCNDYLEVDHPINQISDDLVFENEETANAAITSLYAKLRDETLLVGNSNGLTGILGLYSDELEYYGTPGFPTENFYNHLIIPSNTLVYSLWTNSYALIYNCNLSIEKLNQSSLNTEILNQLKGEALFIRSLVHFYLLQLFGKIPYIETTNFEINQNVHRVDENIVYNNLIADLILAKQLISQNYIGPERVRANKSVVSAILAKVYLFYNDWTNAELEASTILDNTSQFYLEHDLDNEFLKDSKSAIFQLKPKNTGDNTLEGNYFLFEQGPPLNVALNPSILNSFEEGDLRKIKWIKEISNNDQTWFVPYKYKKQFNTGSSIEYSIIFRTAEQYLIRAEARLKNGYINGALADLNKIRTRAGLEEFTNSNETEILNQIIKERKNELFTEQGIRWFDIKRFQLGDTILAPIKPNWKFTNYLLPIPENELINNPNLNPQNPGY